VRFREDGIPLKEFLLIFHRHFANINTLESPDTLIIPNFYLQPSAMYSSEIQPLRDCALLAITSSFGIAYFTLFMLQFLILHLSSSPIINTLTVVLFGVGIMLWCFSALCYRFLCVFQGESAAEWQRLELGSFLLLIWTTSLPTTVFLFPPQSTIQMAYISAFTTIATCNMLDFLCCESSIKTMRNRFPYHCISLILLSLVPTIYALTEKSGTPPSLAFEYCWLVLLNLAGAGFYIFQPLERLGLVRGWRPSLYGMHLILAYSLTCFSKVVSSIALSA
jgi:predicted membrane channel-forming protein YqfA (hemolysin III family)